jgi:SAM-dependent methyltransferase
VVDEAMSEVRLPRGVRIIDCSIRTILRQHQMRGPFCHVGSLINKPDVTADMVARTRRAFLDHDPAGFTGIDLFPGPNVDLVGDLCDPNFLEERPDLVGKFKTVFCYALLEHVKNPFNAAKTINKLIAPGGHLYFGGPWAWGYHPYPADYFRISFDGLEVLFPELEWRQRWYMSHKKNVGIELDDRRGEKKIFRVHNIDGVSALLTDIGMPYLNLGAVGQKPAP